MRNEELEVLQAILAKLDSILKKLDSIEDTIQRYASI
jgi:hypothetical protein